MTALTEAEVRVVAAEAHHRRLSEAYVRGEPVDVALKLAVQHLLRARDALREIAAEGTP